MCCFQSDEIGDDEIGDGGGAIHQQHGTHGGGREGQSMLPLYLVLAFFVGLAALGGW